LFSSTIADSEMPDAPLYPEDDDAELELEPIDPEILAIERQRGQHKIESVAGKIDVDELYGDSNSHADLDVDWSRWKQFRFSTRHLMMATALLAVGLTLKQMVGLCGAISVVAVTALVAGWVWVSRLERRQDEARVRRREDFLASQAKPGQPAPAVAAVPASAELAPRGPRFDIHFAFSMRELLLTTTVAAVALGLLQWVSPDKLALALGIVALGGLIVNALGFEPPRLVVLTWWLLMAMYLVVGVVAAFRSDAQAALPRSGSPAQQAIGLA
jgi:hypothetical protein